MPEVPLPPVHLQGLDCCQAEVDWFECLVCLQEEFLSHLSLVVVLMREPPFGLYI